MKRHITYLLFFIFLSVIYACTKPEVQQVTSTFVEPVKIKMIEAVDSVNRTLTLRCYTQKIYECFNYGIQTDYSVTDDKITITFMKVVVPDICLTAFGPASVDIDLKGLSNNTYELEVNFSSETVKGQLDVTAGSFVATVPTQTKVQFVNPELKRIPANAIFGTVHYHFASSTSLVDRFIDTLQLYGAVPTLYAPGDYGQFEIAANGEIKQKQDPGYYFTRYYIFHYPGSSTPLKDLVRRFGVNYSDSLSIKLHTSKGETFRSWVK